MSHKATHWLATIEPNRMTSGEFRALFHLCDCHNPANGCYPTQAYLMGVTGLSNGGLNKCLSRLEADGLILRHRTRENKTKRQNPTRYILGFEIAEPQEPTPLSGGGKREKSRPGNDESRLHPSGVGAVSTLTPDPSPLLGQSRLHPSGEEPVNKPVKNLRTTRAYARAAPRPVPFFTDDERFEAKQIAKHLETGGSVRVDGIAKRVVDCLISERMVSDDQARMLRVA